MEGERASAKPICRGVAAIMERLHAVLVSSDVPVEVLTESWYRDYVDGRLGIRWSLEEDVSYQ